MDLATRRTQLEMAPDNYSGLFSFKGWYELRDEGEASSTQHFEGDLRVHLPLLGPLAERAIAGGSARTWPPRLGSSSASWPGPPRVPWTAPVPDQLARTLAGAVAAWPGPGALGVVSRKAVEATAGQTERSFPWASVTKLLVALSCLVASEEGTIDLDDAVGPRLDPRPSAGPRFGPAFRRTPAGWRPPVAGASIPTPA